MLDIDSGFASKFDLASLFKIRSEDGEIPGLGARFKATTPLTASQASKVTKVFEESFSAKAKLVRLEGTTLRYEFFLVKQIFYGKLRTYLKIRDRCGELNLSFV